MSFSYEMIQYVLIQVIIQVGVGLMVLQQFGGVNAIAYYASAIFELAGS